MGNETELVHGSKEAPLPIMRRSLFGQASILIAGLALVALTWLGTLDATRAEREEATAHARADVANQVLVFEQELRRQFLALDQTIGILEREWERNPADFDLNAWQKRAMVLADLALHVIVANEDGAVIASTRPELLGQSIAGRDYFRNRKNLEKDDGKMFIGSATRGMVTAAWQMNLVRRLDYADGRFAGVISMSYDTSVLTKFFRAADLGSNGLIALVSTPLGQLHAIVGPPGTEPGGSISESQMFRAMIAAPDGIWIGPSAPDGIIRINAFRRVVDRNLSVVVGVDLKEALRASEAWQSGAMVFATVITLALIIMTGALVMELRAARSRESQLDRDRAILKAANIDLAAARGLADARSAQLQATLLGMSDGVAMVGPDLRLVQWNPRFPEYTGVPAEILRVGLPMEDILRAQAHAGEFGTVDVQAEVTWRLAALRAGNLAGRKERARPNGRILELRRSFLPLGGFVTLYTDITERKQTEETLRQARELAETAMEDKSRFVAMVSHEIRTPLTTLLNGVALLSDSHLAPAQRSLLDLAQRAGDALLGLVNDILEMSRMEAGQLSLHLSEFELRPQLMGVLDMFRTQARERGIRLRLQIADGVPTTLTTDPSRLRQVLINLLSNAAKFADPGEVVLEVSITSGVRKSEPGNRRLRISVRDPGPVIDVVDRVRLFQPFARLEHGSHKMQPGTGLGLAICQRLASLLDGAIGYRPAGMQDGVEAGNEFWLSLPLLEQPGRLAVVVGHIVPYKMLPRTRILLVEDVPANQLITATLLRRHGHLVDVASGGEEALQAIARNPYDIVLMDIFMPGMDGYEATRRLRVNGQAPNSPLACLPILALTANAGPEERARCRAAGMNDMLSKPVEVPNLLAAIARFAWPANPARTIFRLPSSVAGDLIPAVNPDPVASLQAGEPASREPMQIRKWEDESEIQIPSLASTRFAELRANLALPQLQKLVDDCLEDLTSRLPALHRSLASGSAAEIEAEAHAMAGMAASYAMGALDSRLRAVIHGARSGGIANWHAAFAGIEEELDRAKSALRAAFADGVAAMPR